MYVNKRGGGEDARQAVVEDHERHHRQDADQAGLDTADERLLAQGGVDFGGLDRGQRDGQGAGVDQLGEVLRLVQW